jgi:hypothetical protein
MTEYYRGERITKLLDRIAELEQILKDAPPEIIDGEMLAKLAQGYADLAIAKAKLTALKGER